MLAWPLSRFRIRGMNYLHGLKKEHWEQTAENRFVLQWMRVLTSPVESFPPAWERPRDLYHMNRKWTCPVLWWALLDVVHAHHPFHKYFWVPTKRSCARCRGQFETKLLERTRVREMELWTLNWLVHGNCASPPTKSVSFWQQSESLQGRVRVSLSSE